MDSVCQKIGIQRNRALDRRCYVIKRREEAAQSLYKNCQIKKATSLIVFLFMFFFYIAAKYSLRIFVVRLHLNLNFERNSN